MEELIPIDRQAVALELEHLIWNTGLLSTVLDDISSGESFSENADDFDSLEDWEDHRYNFAWSYRRIAADHLRNIRARIRYGNIDKCLPLFDCSPSERDAIYDLARGLARTVKLHEPTSIDEWTAGNPIVLFPCEEWTSGRSARKKRDLKRPYECFGSDLLQVAQSFWKVIGYASKFSDNAVFIDDVREADAEASADHGRQVNGEERPPIPCVSQPLKDWDGDPNKWDGWKIVEPFVKWYRRPSDFSRDVWFYVQMRENRKSFEIAKESHRRPGWGVGESTVPRKAKQLAQFMGWDVVIKKSGPKSECTNSL